MISYKDNIQVTSTTTGTGTLTQAAAVTRELQSLGIKRFMRVRYVNGVRREIWQNVLTRSQEFYRVEK